MNGTLERMDSIRRAKMKNFDVHIEVELGDYLSFEAETPEEAREKMKQYLIDNFDSVVEGLSAGLEFIEESDIKITDVVEY